jgi:hypothetical protein
MNKRKEIIETHNPTIGSKDALPNHPWANVAQTCASQAFLIPRRTTKRRQSGDAEVICRG